MEKQLPVVAVQNSKKTGFVSRLTTATGLALAGASGLALTQGANAAVLDFSAASEELAGVQTAVVGIIGAVVVLIGIGIAWAYFKRTAK